MEALAARGAATSRAALLLRDASNYLNDVVAAAGPDADSVRDSAAEALSRCESGLRTMAGGAARGAAAAGGGVMMGGPGGGGLGPASALLGWAEKQFGGR